MSRKNNIRKGCKDIWNAFMCEGADFTSHSKNDIPFCPTTATEMPKAIITWCEAKRLYRNALARKDKLFFVMHLSVGSLMTINSTDREESGMTVRSY